MSIPSYFFKDRKLGYYMLDSYVCSEHLVTFADHCTYDLGLWQSNKSRNRLD